MKKVYWIKGTALLLCAGLLVGLCGCGGDGDKPTPTTTTTTTATTTTTSTTTTAGEETTTTTGETTTTTAVPVTDALQIGGKYFTLDGVTFEMGTSPEKLLAHLGEPKEQYSGADPAFYGTLTTYRYEHVVVETYAQQDIEKGEFDENDLSQQAICDVYFTDSHYSFDTIAVGSTIEDLERTIPAERKKYDKPYYYGSGLIGGLSCTYQTDKTSNAWWYMFFSEEAEDYWGDNQTLPTGAQIACIRISSGKNSSK